jgi:hypothetical protein
VVLPPTTDVTMSMFMTSTSDHTTVLHEAMQIARREGLRALLRRSTAALRDRVLYRLQRHDATRQLYESRFEYADYWEDRYASGVPSGPGSEGEHAEFKASVVNGLIDEYDVDSVLEFGCGDGAQLELVEYPDYVGLEVSESAVRRCAERFADDQSKSFFLYRPTAFVNHGAVDADLVVSLEVLFHVVDREEWEATLEDMFTAANECVVVFSSNRDDPEPDRLHIRHRRFTDYVEREFPAFDLVETVENPFEERHSDFYVYERTSGDAVADSTGGSTGTRASDGPHARSSAPRPPRPERERGPV